MNLLSKNLRGGYTPKRFIANFGLGQHFILFSCPGPFFQPF